MSDCYDLFANDVVRYLFSCTSKMPSTQLQDSKQVNNLLHTLRGEQFRQLQNLKGSRAHLSAIRSHNAPTLPVGLTLPEYDLPNLNTITTLNPPPRASYSGPAPPKSWTHTPERDVQDTPAWRAKALSLVGSCSMDNFTDPTRVPSLALLCLQMILMSCTSKKELQEIAPFIPPHLRRDVVRYCAIHSPLPKWKLYALFNVHGHADGEIIIVGPSASLREQHFLFDASSRDTDAIGEGVDWEEEDPSSPLHSLVLVSTPLTPSTLLTFPPTLTHLALINLPVSVPLHRLPKTCPLLFVLDLSYNVWLSDAVEQATNALNRIEWSRWGHLQILGLRDCYISDDLIEKVNKGRWDDVNVVR
ncbi:hypothetical protein CPB84DRAFT_1723203 [Gymnopilus junonius]|uniref:Uncharacterized protein n=1 Tax=Gymnopilus junonius TaxID=109634 RepID=A0A9P5P006_GYMJU|nr:hypothetical protein CPB84DRAFT_1723203 [Gymnopilus junonius]